MSTIDITKFDPSGENPAVQELHKKMSDVLGQWQGIEEAILLLILSGPSQSTLDRLTRIFLMSLRQGKIRELATIFEEMAVQNVSSKNIPVLLAATDVLMETNDRFEAGSRCCESLN